MPVDGKYVGIGVGECAIRAPRDHRPAVGNAPDRYWRVWPVTGYGDRCGEFRSRLPRFVAWWRRCVTKVRT